MRPHLRSGIIGALAAFSAVANAFGNEAPVPDEERRMRNTDRLVTCLIETRQQVGVTTDEERMVKLFGDCVAAALDVAQSDIPEIAKQESAFVVFMDRHFNRDTYDRRTQEYFRGQPAPKAKPD